MSSRRRGRSRKRSAPGSARSSGALGFGLAVGAVASVLLGAHFAKRVLTPAPRPENGVTVLTLEPSETSPGGIRVWLRGPDADLEGEYSFIFDARSRETQHLAGHARLGPVLRTVRTVGGVCVLRDVLGVQRGDLRPGARGRVTGWWYTEPEQLGYDVRTVALPQPFGVGWGWVISPERPEPGRWAVHVHGRGALPHETLRGVGVFAEAGVTSLVIAYRNDMGAPSGLGGRYGLGLAEQQDVDAAVGWTRTQGATRVTLVGWSMGGTAALLAAGEGRNSDLVDGMVLDSPALDWPALLRRQARIARLPGFIAELGILLLRTGRVRGAVPGAAGTDIGGLTAQRLAALIRVPTLIHASPDDTFVPWQGALRVARLRSAFVRLRPGRGEHVKLWNVDPEGWNAETAQFIRGLGDPRPNARG